MTDPRSFGEWMQRERERRNITLRVIADRTKIGTGLLEALERGDVSRWPGGIYRRAFIRSYADAIGLDGDLVVANFERVFPADGSAPAAGHTSRANPEQEEMRISLVTPALGINGATLKTALADLSIITVLAVAGYAAAGMIGLWCAIAVASLVFHLSRVLGLPTFFARRHAAQVAARLANAPARAEVVNFSTEQKRASRRARAKRVLADLSHVASSAGLSSRRRAAR
jgi:transcriptional regulator with XRE-family HTH domain